MTCVFGPINRGSFGPNRYFPGTFWPQPSLLGSLKRLKIFFGQISHKQKFFEFWILGIFRGFWGLLQGLGPSRPQNGSKTPNTGQKRVLGITLAGGGVESQTYPTFSLFFLRVPDRFRRVRDPNGTILTTFRLPGARPGRPGPGPKIFSVGGSRGLKHFSPRFFCSKTLFIGSWVGFEPKNKHWFWAPLDPQKSPFGPILHTKWPKMGFNNGQKNAFFGEILFWLEIILFYFLL